MVFRIAIFDVDMFGAFCLIFGSYVFNVFCFVVDVRCYFSCFLWYFFLNVRYMMRPMNAPYHSVPSLVMIAIPTEAAAGMLLSCRRPNIVASATPRPPGSMLIAPARDAKLKMNVASSILMEWLKPCMMR